MPAAVAWVGAQIVDAVNGRGQRAGRVELVVLEGLLVVALAAAQRALGLCQSLLRAQLGQRVNVMILEGDHAVAVALRGFGVLRQADARVARPRAARCRW